MNKFNVGDMVRRKEEGWRTTVGKSYEVLGVWEFIIDVENDEGDKHNYLEEYFELVVPNKLQVGETYTSHNGQSWVAIYEEDGFVWMKSPDGGAAYVFKRDGTTISMGSNSGYSINWEATKGPIIEEGVYVTGGYHLGTTGKGSYDNILVNNLTVTTVDGVPDWTTLACKEIN